MSAKFWKKYDADRVNCLLCSHNCLLGAGEHGKCFVRYNEGGELRSHVTNLISSTHLDPVEKKPLYHFLPGSKSFSVGSVGCNFSCAFCQNFSTSRMPSDRGVVQGNRVSPQQILDATRSAKAESISYTYNEPTIFFELVSETAELALEAGIRNILVTNGFASPACLKSLGGSVHAANVDIKAFTESFYRDLCGARLSPVLDNVQRMLAMGWWVEVTTLVIPGVNDSVAEISGLASFIHDSLGASVPWHLSRFYGAYRMANHPGTPLEVLERCRDIGRDAGLQHVYIGNIATHAGHNTYCPSCKED